MSNLFIGLLSGTSMDGVDAAIVDYSENNTQLIATHYCPFDSDLKNSIKALCREKIDIQNLGETDCKLGHVFADAVNTLLKNANLDSSKINAIGSHGQAIWHAPNNSFPFTIQIGDPNIIAHKTGIKTIADFRRRDIAAGGQGAPLTPLFHEFLFRDKNINTIVLNIGGISNVTVLTPDEKTFGFDTGPGNCLMDAWIHQHKNESYDKNGEWAGSGECVTPLLNKLLNDDYFQKPFPKSTGPDYFNLTFLNAFEINKFNPADVQATLLALTADSISESIKTYLHSPSRIIICGGGIHNDALINQLKNNLNSHQVLSSEEFGIHPDWIEAMAFAWFAKQTFEGNALDYRNITGANIKTILGGTFA